MTFSVPRMPNQSRQPTPGSVFCECGGAWPGAAALNRWSNNTTHQTMKIITTFLVSLLTLAAARAGDQRSFATETEITFDRKAGHYLVVARVSELIAEKGEPVEKLIAAPRMTVAAGKAESITDTAPDGKSVRAEISWPVADSDQAASLLVTLKWGGKVVTRSKVKLDLRKT